MQHDNDELDPLVDDYDEKRLQGYGQHPKSEDKPRDFDSRRGKPIEKTPAAYGVTMGGKLEHVTLRKESAEYWASKKAGRGVVPLYDHPSKEAMREFARWLREGDSSNDHFDPDDTNDTYNRWHGGDMKNT